MSLMRSLLFVPANRADFLSRAREVTADVIVLDLEDSVPRAEKETARNALPAAIDALKAAGKTVHVRINHLDTGLTREDLATAIRPGLDGLNFPKTQGARDIRLLDVLIREAETHNNVRPGTVALIPTIETARGVLRCEEIALASTRIVGLTLGAYDYVADLGITRTKDGHELEYVRRVIVHCCAAYGLQPLDTPYGDFQDEAGLAIETEYIKSIGFKGKYLIHPRQAEHVNRVFEPSAGEIESAQRVVSAFDDAVAQGHASVEVDGRMVDTPVARRARDLIEYAQTLSQTS